MDLDLGPSFANPGSATGPIWHRFGDTAMYRLKIAQLGLANDTGVDLCGPRNNFTI